MVFFMKYFYGLHVIYLAVGLYRDFSFLFSLYDVPSHDSTPQYTGALKRMRILYKSLNRQDFLVRCYYSKPSDEEETVLLKPTESTV